MRCFLLFLLMSGALVVSAQKGIPKYETYLKPFYHGVASGDPLQDRVIIWTRYTPEDETTSESFEIQWEFATDVELNDVIQSGTVLSKPENDFTVKVDVKNLEAGKHYYYRFTAPDGKHSLIGRTKTAVDGNVENLRLAVISCSSIFSGYFNAYKRISERADLDAVVHLGDYIYDFVDENEQIRIPSPLLDNVTTKEEFRAMHNYYKLDQDFMMAHQQHPWIILWDNHDVSSLEPENMENLLGTMEAFYEWTPVRRPDSLNVKNIYRNFRFGDMLDIFITDLLIHKDPNLSATESGVDDTNRTMLGAEQYDWLTENLKNSLTKWRVIGGQKQMGQFQLFGLPDEFPIEIPISQGGFFFNSKGWDGYPAERRKILKTLRDNNINNTMHISGDIHMFIGMDLVENPYDSKLYKKESGKGSIAVDFCPGSVSRGNIDETLGFQPSPDFRGFVNNTVRTLNPHFRAFDGFDHGYGILDFRPERTIGEFWSCPILRVDNAQRFLRGLVIYDGDNHWAREQVTEPTTPFYDEYPPLAPFADTSIVLSNNEQFLNSFSRISEVYPHPLTSVSYLDLTPASRQRISVSVFDYTGKEIAKVFSAEVEKNVNYRIEFNQSKLRLSKGMYFIGISNELGSGHKKLLVH